MPSISKERFRRELLPSPGPDVLQFCENAYQFRAQELLAYVLRQVGPVASDSPSLIMRRLKQCGRLDYEVKSKSEGLYQILQTAPTQTALSDFLTPPEMRDDG